VILDEFAFHKDSEAIWKALFPVISRGYKLRIVSTPAGKGNRFHLIFTGDNNFSKHFVDIYEAVKSGVPHDIAQLKEGIDDEDGWTQEFECKFVDEATAFLTYDMIAACADELLGDEIGYEQFDLSVLDGNFKGDIYCGVDIGRKKDLTVITLEELLGDCLWTRLMITCFRVKFKDQQQLLGRLIRKFDIARTCIDATGIGAQMAEDTAAEFGPYRVEEVTFTNSVKNDLAVRTRRHFEDRRIRIPNSRILRDDLHSIKKTTTAAGNIRFDAERTKDGHADRFWSLALSLMAAGQPAVIPEVILL